MESEAPSTPSLVELEGTRRSHARLSRLVNYHPRIVLSRLLNWYHPHNFIPRVCVAGIILILFSVLLIVIAAIHERKFGDT